MQPTNFDQHVLYDTVKMFKGAQEERISTILKQGKSQISHSKNRKVDPNIPLTDQLFVYRDKMNPFYKSKNINIITEKQVKDGEEVFNFTSTEAADGQEYT